jgi:hypothetical protein
VLSAHTSNKISSEGETLSSGSSYISFVVLPSGNCCTSTERQVLNNFYRKFTGMFVSVAAIDVPR